MTSIATRKFRLFTARQFEESFDGDKETKFYIAVGRDFAWDDDANPPTPVDTVANTNYDFWDSLYAAKKITAKSVSFAIPRIDWEANTVYDEYKSNNPNLANSNFYIMTNQRNVYKCLFNNNDNPSTDKPTGTATSNIRTNDGYIWKYMFTVTADEALRFLTPEYIPVQVLDTNDGTSQWQIQQAASNGAIEIIEVANTGSGYKTHFGTFQAVSNSTQMRLDSTANNTTNIYNFSGLYIDSGLGAGQVSQIIDYDGQTNRVKLKSGFATTPNTSSTYSVAPYIDITGNGNNATAYANVAGGGVSKITMVNQGVNYSFANVSIMANSVYGSGATAIPQLSPQGGHGSNAFSELYGHNVILNAKFIGDEGNTIPSNTEFRVVSLITNPVNANGSVANNTNYQLTTTLNLTDMNGTFENGEFVSGDQSKTTGRVLEYANTTSLDGSIRATHVYEKFTNLETISGNTSGATATIIGTKVPELRLREGDIFYQQNRVPVKRDTDQREDVKLVIKF